MIDGAAWHGTGTVVDPSQAKRVPKGAFMIDHANKVHWGGNKEESGAYLIAGIGPATNIEVPKSNAAWSGGDPSALTILTPDKIQWKDNGNNKNWDFGTAGILRTWWGGVSNNWSTHSRCQETLLSVIWPSMPGKGKLTHSTRSLARRGGLASWHWTHPPGRFLTRSQILVIPDPGSPFVGEEKLLPTMGRGRCTS